jgi:hypothetical protein
LLCRRDDPAVRQSVLESRRRRHRGKVSHAH